MKKNTNQLIIPILVGTLCLLNVVRNVEAFNPFSIFVSIIGLIGVLLFFLNNKNAPLAFYGWMFAQVVTLETESFTYFTDHLPEISLHFSFSGKSTLFAINFMPFIYLFIYNRLEAYNLIGKKIILVPLKAGSKVLQTEGEILAVVDLKKEGKWFKVLSEDQRELYIKPKGEEKFSNKKYEVAYVNLYNEQEHSLHFLDWGKVKLH